MAERWNPELSGGVSLKGRALGGGYLGTPMLVSDASATAGGLVSVGRGRTHCASIVCLRVSFGFSHLNVILPGENHGEFFRSPRVEYLLLCSKVSKTLCVTVCWECLCVYTLLINVGAAPTQKRPALPVPATKW